MAEVITLVSIYGLWEPLHPSVAGTYIYADAAVHRLISDLSRLVDQSGKQKIIVAGDLNILFGYGEYGSPYWKRRYATVFDRFNALGLSFVGPQAPNGKHASPWPSELPAESRNVPTYHTRNQQPASATRQLDFVFASKLLTDRVTVRALNEPEDWGPSDHCRVEISVGLPGDVALRQG